jgi:cell division septation protein DedD
VDKIAALEANLSAASVLQQRVKEIEAEVGGLEEQVAAYEEKPPVKMEQPPITTTYARARGTTNPVALNSVTLSERPNETELVSKIPGVALIRKASGLETPPVPPMTPLPGGLAPF